MFRDRQSDRFGGLRSAELHRLVSTHHSGHARASLPGRDLRCGPDAACGVFSAGRNIIPLPLASSHHARSASFARLPTLAPASQPNAAALLVLVAAPSSVSGQLFSYETPLCCRVTVIWLGQTIIFALLFPIPGNLPGVSLDLTHEGSHRCCSLRRLFHDQSVVH